MHHLRLPFRQYARFFLFFLAVAISGCIAKQSHQAHENAALPSRPPECGQFPTHPQWELLTDGHLEQHPDSITTLYLNGESLFVDLPPLKNLRRVVVHNCRPPFSFAFLAESPCLDTLEMEACRQLHALQVPFKQLTALRSLTLRNCEYINEEILELEGLTSLSLTRLEDYSPLLLDWSGLAKLKSLQSLEVVKSNLSDLDGILKNAHNLRELRVVDGDLKEIGGQVCGLKLLEKVDLRDNEIRKVPPCISNIAQF